MLIISPLQRQSSRFTSRAAFFIELEQALAGKVGFLPAGLPNHHWTECSSPTAPSIHSQERRLLTRDGDFTSSWGSWLWLWSLLNWGRKRLGSLIHVLLSPSLYFALQVLCTITYLSTEFEPVCLSCSDAFCKFKGKKKLCWRWSENSSTSVDQSNHSCMEDSDHIATICIAVLHRLYSSKCFSEYLVLCVVTTAFVRAKGGI